MAFRVIAGGGHPDHARISDFRRVHLKALAGLFVEILRLYQKAGLVKLGSVELDGTKVKVKVNASKHKAMSYERMKKDEQRLREKVSELLAKAEQVDEEDDAIYGEGRIGDELPEDLRHAKDRRERIRQLMKWGIDPYIATGRRHHDEEVIALRGRAPFACGELAQMMSMLSSVSARPNCVSPPPRPVAPWCAIRKTPCLSL